MHGHGPAPKASIVAGNQHAVVGRVESALSPSSPSQALLAHGINKEKLNTLISPDLRKQYFLMPAMA